MFIKLTRTLTDPKRKPVLVNIEKVIHAETAFNMDDEVIGTFVQCTDGRSFYVTESFDKVCQMLGWRQSGEVLC